MTDSGHLVLRPEGERTLPILFSPEQFFRLDLMQTYASCIVLILSPPFIIPVWQDLYVYQLATYVEDEMKDEKLSCCISHIFLRGDYLDVGKL